MLLQSFRDEFVTKQACELEITLRGMFPVQISGLARGVIRNLMVASISKPSKPVQQCKCGI